MAIDTTIFLSKLIGIFCLVMGASMLKRDMMMEVFRELSRERPLSYVMGVLMLILGLLVTLTHARWGNPLSIVITLLGWGILLESALFLFCSKKVVAKYVNTLENKTVYYLIVLGYLFVGAYLSYNGFVVFGKI